MEWMGVMLELPQQLPQQLEQDKLATVWSSIDTRSTTCALQYRSTTLLAFNSYPRQLLSDGHLTIGPKSRAAANGPIVQYDPTQQETTHHHGTSLGAACPAAAQKVPEFLPLTLKQSNSTNSHEKGLDHVSLN